MMDQHTTTQAPAEGQSLLVFRVGRVDCAVPVRTVDSIIMPQALTPLPRQGEDYLGVLQYRDHAVPVVSLQRKFGQPLPPFEQGRFIMADVAGQVTGFWVDEILEIIEAEEYQWSDSPRFCADDSFPRTLLWRDRIVLYSDFSRLLALRESAALEQWLGQTEEAEEADERTTVDVAAVSEASHGPDETASVAAQAATTVQAHSRPAEAADEPPSEAQAESVPATGVATDTGTHDEAIELSSFLDPAAEPVATAMAASGLSSTASHFELLSGSEEQAEADAGTDPALEAADPGEHVPATGVAPLTGLDSLPGERPLSEPQRPPSAARAGVSGPRPTRKAVRRQAPVSRSQQSRRVAPKPPQRALAARRQARFPWPAVTCLSLLLAILLSQAAHLIGARLEWQRLAQAEPLRLLSEQAAPAPVERVTPSPAAPPVPGPVGKLPPAEAVTNTPGQAAPLRAGPPWGVHFVVAGDTLWALSALYLDDPFRYPDLARWSRIKNPDRIYPDDKVLYPYPTPAAERIQPF